MNKKLLPLACAGFLLTMAVLALPEFFKGQVRGADESSEKYQKLYNQGNYKEAFEGFKKLALEPIVIVFTCLFFIPQICVSFL